MKKLFHLAAVLLTVCLAACQSESTSEGASLTPPSSQSQDSQSGGSATGSPVSSELPSSAETAPEETDQRQIRMTAEGETYTIILYETPAANALYEILPLDLTFEDYNRVEKISYLPENLSLPTAEEPDGYDPSIGDLCLYAPWGNLSLFYQDFGYSDGLVSLGRLETGIESISAFSDGVIVTLERME